MHGTIGRPANPLDTAAGEGWNPYIPNMFSIREVTRQLGHHPTLYVMRKKDGFRRLYRACTPQELSAIELRDISTR